MTNKKKVDFNKFLSDLTSNQINKLTIMLLERSGVVVKSTSKDFQIFVLPEMTGEQALNLDSLSQYVENQKKYLEERLNPNKIILGRVEPLETEINEEVVADIKATVE